MTANDLAARQDESDNSRKRLVEQSREFKRVTAEVRFDAGSLRYWLRRKRSL